MLSLGGSTIAGESGERFPSENERNGARFQGRYVTKIAEQLYGKQKDLLGLS